MPPTTNRPPFRLLARASGLVWCGMACAVVWSNEPSPVRPMSPPSPVLTTIGEVNAAPLPVPARSPAPTTDGGGEPLETVNRPAANAGLPPGVPAGNAPLRLPKGMPLLPLAPAVERQQFQRRVIRLPGAGVRVVVANGPRGQAAWTSSILRTTQVEVARERAEVLLDELIARVVQQSELREPQWEKLRLAGQGDINRFLSQCESFVAEVTAYEADQDRVDNDVLRNYWVRSSDLQLQLSRGLHGPGSLFRKQLEQLQRPTEPVSESRQPPRTFTADPVSK